jgi:reactive intermediate/imine deaminase
MDRRTIQSDDAPKADAILSQAIISASLIFVSGQVHALNDNTLVEGSTKDKVAQIMKNISAILGAAGAGLGDVVKVVVYVTDMGLMPELNEVYPTYFTKPYPVREAVCVQALPLGAQIEISVFA